MDRVRPAGITSEGSFMTHTTEVLFPSSVDEAVSLFGDGAGVTVVAGGTIVVPEITYGRLAPARALMLSGAGLDGIEDDGTAVVVGAGTPVARLAQLADAVPALAACALNVADGEIRGQATVGGNLCAGHGADAPRGDLQGAFLALGATARSVGAGGERSEPLEAFLDDREGRLLLDVRFERPAASAFASLDYPHTHEYTVLAVSGVRTQGGEIRLAATAEAAASDPERAGAAALDDVSLADDALASEWYRSRALPVLVRRVLTQLEEAS
jgi:aerobic carbon-monoxide dehydrogenase medium subunit